MVGMRDKPVDAQTLATIKNFQTTPWSLVLAANDSENAEAQDALAGLCGAPGIPSTRLYDDVATTQSGEGSRSGVPG